MILKLLKKFIITLNVLVFLSINSYSWAENSLPPEQSDKLVEEWTSELMSYYKQAESRTNKVIKPFRITDILKNEFFIFVFRNFGTGKELEAVSANPNEMTLELLKKAKNSPFYSLMNGSFIERLEEESAQSGLIVNSVDRIASFGNDFRVDFEKYKQQYGAQYFSEDAFTRSVSTVTGIRFFASVVGSNPPIRALNAIALLHPITDDLIDNGLFPKKSLQKLIRLLDGDQSVLAENEVERVVFGLVNDIYINFTEKEHPFLHWAIRRLNAEQIRSSSAQVKGAKTEALLDVAFKKGGLSMVVASYIAYGGLSLKEFEYFFKQVAIFQLMDDFSDIYKDIDEGVETIWTQEVTNGKSIIPPLRGFIQTQRLFENDLQSWISEVRGGEEISKFLNFGLWTTLVTGLVYYDHLRTRSVLRTVNRQFPLFPKHMIKFMRIFDSNLKRSNPTSLFGTCELMMQTVRPPKSNPDQ